MARQRVLVPVDGSSFSKSIFPVIQQFFDPKEVELILLEAIDAPAERSRMPPSGGSVLGDFVLSSVAPDEYAQMRRSTESQQHDTLEALKYQHQQALEAAARTLREVGYPVSYAVDVGDPAQNILNYATDMKVNMIAMATHGHTGISRLLLGSVAQKVLQGAKVPVLLLRPF